MEASTAELLAHGTLTVQGKFAEASNFTLLVTCESAEARAQAVFKPVAGMRPLHDFNASTLAHREVAAYELSQAAGWNCVPTTVWRAESDFGPGSIQAYVEDGESEDFVDVLAADVPHEGMRIAFTGEDEEGAPVNLVHRDDTRLRKLALFDALTNNADRKAGHILKDGGSILGIDNGLTFHHEDKLRTVLWGWAGETLLTSESALLDITAQLLQANPPWLAEHEFTSRERDALMNRLRRLQTSGVMPSPDPRRRCIPWPVF